MTAVEAQNPLKAAFYMLGAVAAFSTMAVAGREALSELDTFEIMGYRSIVGLFVVLTIAAMTQGGLRRIRARRLGLHTVRNIFHFAGQNLWFYAIGLIPLAQMVALEFTTPLWIAVLAPLFIGERMTRWRAVAAIMGFVGVLIIARPGQISFTEGHLSAILAAIGFAGQFMCTKVLLRTENTTSVLFWMTAMQLVMGFACAAPGGITIPSAENWLWVALIGVSGLTAHYCVTSALALADVSVVAPIDFARLPVITVVGMTLYGEQPELAVFLGSVMVFGGNLLNIRAERKRRA